MSVAATTETAIHNNLDRALDAGRPALICYLPLGDPHLRDDAVQRYADAGVDVLEIGVPVPNPYADGEVVRDSMRRTLRAGVTPEWMAEATAMIRDRHPGLATVWMSYGALLDVDRWVDLTGRAGVDGLLFVESARHFGVLKTRLARHRVHLCQLLPRDLSEPDLRSAQESSGYLMLQAVGTHTGGGDPDRPLPDSAALIRRLRRGGVTTPIMLGIGISTPDQVRQAIAMGASGVVIGTAAVEHGLRGEGELSRYLTSLRAALG